MPSLQFQTSIGQFSSQLYTVLYDLIRRSASQTLKRLVQHWTSRDTSGTTISLQNFASLIIPHPSLSRKSIYVNTHSASRIITIRIYERDPLAIKSIVESTDRRTELRTIYRRSAEPVSITFASIFISSSASFASAAILSGTGGFSSNCLSVACFIKASATCETKFEFQQGNFSNIMVPSVKRYRKDSVQLSNVD